MEESQRRKLAIFSRALKFVWNVECSIARKKQIEVVARTNSQLSQFLTMSFHAANADGDDRKDDVYIDLPTHCKNILSWKVKAGSCVRKGETIAIASMSPSHPKYVIESTPKSTKKEDETAAGKKSGAIKSLLSSNALSSTDKSSTQMKPADPSKTETTKKPQKMSARARMLARAKKAKLDDKQDTKNVAANNNANALKIQAPEYGFLHMVPPGNASTSVAYIKPCTHPTMYGDLCTVCGYSQSNTEFDGDASTSSINYGHGKNNKSMPLQKLCGNRSSETDRSSNNTSANTSSKTKDMIISGGHFRISHSEAESLGKADQNRLKRMKKLSLVLDLDHTLLHATADRRAEIECKNRDDVRFILLPIIPMNQQPHQVINMVHFIKLRPHLKEFLEGLQNLYEISIYTAGTRGYAEKVVNIISRHMVGATLEAEDLVAMKEELKNAENGFFPPDVLKKHFESAREKENNKNVSKAKEPTSSKSDSKVHPSSILKPNTTLKKKKEKNDSDDKTDSKAKIAEVDLATSTTKDESIKSKEEETSKKRKETESKTNKEIISVDTIPKKKRKRVSFDNLSLITPVDTKSKEMKGSTAKARYIKELRDKISKGELLEQKALQYREKVFGKRIVSRTDVKDMTDSPNDIRKSLKRCFPCGGSMAAIVDDREDVWVETLESDDKNNSKQGKSKDPPSNLLLVKPYKWTRFLGYQEVNNAAGVDLTANNPNSKKPDEISDSTNNNKATKDEEKKHEKSSTSENEENKHDPSEDDIQLLWTCDVLKRLHKRFYSSSSSSSGSSLSKGWGKSTTSEILSQMREEIFGPDVAKNKPRNSIVFSGVFPLPQSNNKRKREKHALERYVEAMGAQILQDVSPQTTHVIAARDGTEKVLKGRELIRCSIIKVSWLMECYWSLEKRDVKGHLLDATAPKSLQIEEKKKRISKHKGINGTSEGNSNILFGNSNQIEAEFDEDDEDNDDMGWFDEDTSNNSTVCDGLL